MNLPTGWFVPPAADQNVLLAELQRELSRGHVLAGRDLSLIARRDAQDDVLVRESGTDAPFWRVHLTWHTESDPRWPHAEPFESFDAFVRDAEGEE